MNRQILVFALAALAVHNFRIAGFFYFRDEFIVYNVKSLIKRE